MYFYNLSIKNKKGFGLVEVLISASILSIFIVSIVVVFQTLLTQASSAVKRTQASFLAEEGIEAIKSIRDRGWASNIEILSSSEVYYLSFVNSRWEIVSEPVVIGSFTRSFEVEEVLRDSSGAISESSGTPDPDTLKVNMLVEWLEKNQTQSKIMSVYITNLHEN